MAFRNAASVVVARIFRIITRSGVVVAEFGAGVVTFLGSAANALKFFHHRAGTADSAISWTSSNTPGNELDIQGPGPGVSGINPGGVPPNYLAFTYNDQGVQQSRIQLQTAPGNSGNPSFSSPGASLILTADAGDTVGGFLLASKGTPFGADSSVGIQGFTTNTDATNLLDIFSPTVPSARTRLQGPYVGDIPGWQGPFNAFNGGAIAVNNGGYANICNTTGLTQFRNTGLWLISANWDIQNVGGAGVFMDGQIAVVGGSFGGGAAVPFSAPRILWPANARLNTTRSLIMFRTNEAPGTVLTFFLQGIASVAGALTAVAGYNTLQILAAI